MVKDFSMVIFLNKGLKYTTLSLAEGYSLETILTKKCNCNIKICKMSKPENICEWDFKNLNWLTTWAHEWYFRIYQKPVLPANKFAIQVRRSKQQNLV